MNPTTLRIRTFRTVFAPVLLLLLGAFLLRSSFAADNATGVLTGRVYNEVNGAYFNNALVTLEGTSLQQLTNEYGEFRFDQVPVGSATLKVVVAGFPAKAATVTVAADQPAVVNVGLRLADGGNGKSTDAVVLDAYVVASEREMNGSAIAINERRAAANLKNVIASDEFGDSPEGNVAELLKEMPGVAIGYNSFDARTVAVRGLPAYGTAVTYDGAPMSSGTQALSRETEFNQGSLNNTARIEVIKSPLPDTRADTIGGSVNIVPKSAFEYSKAVFTYRANLSANLSRYDGGSYLSLGKSPFSRGATTLVFPGVDLGLIKPISKSLGIAVSATSSYQFTPEPMETSVWKPTQSASSIAVASAPFLSSVGLQDGPKIIYRRSFGTTIDWRPTARDVLNLGVQVNWWRAIVDQDLQTLSIGTPTAYGPTFTQSGTGAASVSRTLTTYDKRAPSFTLLTKYRHNGPVWTIEGGASYSQSWSKVEALGDGVVKSLSMSASNLTMRFDGIQDSVPRSITGQGPGGSADDWRHLSTYRLTSGTSGNPQETRNWIQAARLNASRDFARTSQHPIRIKVGTDVRRESRDYRSPSTNYTFVGPDKIANTADDLAANYDLVEPSWSTVSLPFGLGRVERPSSSKAYDLLVRHPEYWVESPTSAISSAATTSQKIWETVPAYYLRADVALFQNRLKLIGGVRYEATYDEGYGLLNDISRTYLHDSAGNVVRDAQGKPVKASTDPVVLTQLQYKERGSHAKRHYGDYYPSFNASFTVTERLMLRGSYARTIARPNISSVIPSITATDPTVTTTVPTISVTNTGLRPWYSNSYDLALEYYFEKPGLISIGVFRKDISDFFGSVRSPVTPAQLAEWGFDDSYANYDVVTTQNIGTARVSGLELEVRRSLDWIPASVGRFMVFFNSTRLHLEGAAANSISSFLPLTMNYGLNYSNSRFTARLTWNQRGRIRNGLISGQNVDPATYNFDAPRLTMDFNAEYRLTKYLSLFTNVRNITNVPWRLEAYAPTTPAYARGTRWIEYGPNALFGIKGSF